jgi:hypothetical protein
MEETWVSRKPGYGSGRPMAREPRVVVRMRVQGRRWRGIVGGGYGGALWEEDMGICCGDGGRKGGVWKCRRAKNVERNVNGGCVVGHANVECGNGMGRTSGCDCVLR